MITHNGKVDYGRLFWATLSMTLAFMFSITCVIIVDKVTDGREYDKLYQENTELKHENFILRAEWRDAVKYNDYLVDRNKDDEEEIQYLQKSRTRYYPTY